MPVFYRDNITILFIHVPRTGGTSVELFFEKNGFRTAYLDRGQAPETLNHVTTCSPQHMDAAILARIFRLSSFDYVFMTVRDPLKRICSAYKLHAHLDTDITAAGIWIRTRLREYADDPYIVDNHIRPQADFWVPGCDVFRLEDGLDAAWVEKLSQRIGFHFPVSDVDRAMEYTVEPSRLALDADCIAAVRNFYRQDYELFGYDSGDTPHADAWA
jgi:hypothetical protein